MTNEKVKISELYNFTERQKEAKNLLKDHKFVLYGGAMGGGKSYWLRWMLVRLLCRWARQGKLRVMAGLFCEDYPALKDRHLSKIGVEFPDWLGELHSDHKECGRAFILRPEYGGGIIALRNLDDPSKYKSAEFAAIAIDELTSNAVEVFNFLRTRLRWPGIADVKFLAGTNPGGIGHGWVKKIWMDKIFEPTEQEAEKFVFIKAKATDNPHLDASYRQTLEGLPFALREAFVNGNWDTFQGQFFQEWSREIHVIRPFELYPQWKRFISVDYGYSAPSAVYWYAVDYQGRVIVYRELYQRGLTFKELGRQVGKLTPEVEKLTAGGIYNERQNISYIAFDPSLEGKSGESGQIGSQLLGEALRENGITAGLIPANNNRKYGWGVMREYLRPRLAADGGQTAGIVWFETCVNAIRTISEQIYDAVRLEDLDSDGEDHAADSTRYGLVTMRTRPSDPERKPRQAQSNSEREFYKRLRRLRARREGTFNHRFELI